MLLDVVTFNLTERMNRHSTGKVAGKGMPPRWYYASFTSCRSLVRMSPYLHLPGYPGLQMFPTCVADNKIIINIY